MYQYKGIDDTIAAISTPSGHGGIGIVRVSGKEALAVADKIFKAKTKIKPSAAKGYSVHYGAVMRGNEIIDEALLTVMRAPKSYTCEDVVEISCHAGVVSLRSILTLVCESGARLAEPGEFTKRAFLNGRIDLPQAEAVLDIIESKTDAFLRVSTNQLKGELSGELERIREELTSIYVEMEAILNFPEDEIDAASLKNLSEQIVKAGEEVQSLLSSSEQGRILKEGIKIVLCGKPNVGKSSLLNILLKVPRAIVSDIAGTTRDTIEETAQIRGVPFQLVDTAGILEPRDLIEEEAIKRSRMYIQSADLVLLLLDASTSLNEQDQKLIDSVKDQNTLLIVNKCDLSLKIDEKSLAQIIPGQAPIKISVTKKEGIAALESAILDSVLKNDSNIGSHTVMISNLRHIQALKECQTALEGALRVLSDKISIEFASEEIKTAVNCLDSITGRNVDADLLDTIFSQFCIGK